MDSCGKDASGNMRAQEMSLTQKFGQFVRTMIWNEPVVSIAYRKCFFFPFLKYHVIPPPPS